MNKDTLVIKRRSDDGSRVITLRLREDLLVELDKLANEVNHSRNELINLMIEHGLQHIEIQ